MDKNRNADADAAKSFSRSLMLIIGAAVAVCIIGWLLKSKQPSNEYGNGTNAVARSTAQNSSDSESTHSALRRKRAATSGSPEEQVASRLARYDKNRRASMHRYAEKFKVSVPPEMEQLFDAAEAGNFEELKRLGDLLRENSHARNDAERDAIRQLSPFVKEIVGVHEAVEKWPAQALMDYGNEVLGSLKPGMVYIGGTDAGRFIPTLVNETSAGESHIVLTQNALADGTYLQYLDFLYGDRMVSLTPEDSQKSFQNYLQDAQRRLAHDQSSPNEPKQVRPGESIAQEKGRLSVFGQTAIMSINELLLEQMLKKNPEMSFALEESFSLPSTYQGATPLGPLIALDSTKTASPVTAETATASLNSWNDIVSKLLATPDSGSSSPASAAYGHMLTAQGNLFASQNLTSQAEQAYRLAQQIAPDDSGTVQQLAALLSQTGRAGEGKQLLDAFARAHPTK